MTIPDTPRLAAVTSYGRRAGSARVRVFEWLDRTGLPAVVSSYTEDVSNAPSVLARRPLSVLRAEQRLRRLPAEIAELPLVLSRQASPFSNGAIEERLLTSAARGVYDFDDALKHAPTGPVDRIWSKRRIWQRAVEAADVVIAGNDTLAEQASEFARHVAVVPSCVDEAAYTPKQTYESEHPLAVWLGSPSTERYLLHRAGPLLTAHRERGLRLRVISAGSRTLGALDVMVDRVQWTPTSVAMDLATADFGVMPLEDTEWSRGKCAYKLLQYGAAALPMVGDPIGANERVLRLADGLGPTDDASWTEALIELIDEGASRRARRGVSGRRAITENYSFRAWEERWRSLVLA